MNERRQSGPRAEYGMSADELNLHLTAALGDIQRENQELRQEARTDSLTGLDNRAAFDDELERLAARHHRSGRITRGGVIVLDLVDFKSVNDTFGHAHGDELLKKVADAIKRVRHTDQAFRWGGDEFAIIVEEGDTEPVLKRVKESIESVKVNGEYLRVSSGQAELREVFQAGPNLGAELFALADRRLYADHARKNRRD